ncbi:MAG: FecR family protein, partial [Sideroxydans sp.]|nr:FecR family protein [Sideroxydans sp.]
MTGCLVMAFCLNTSWAATAGYAQFVHGSVLVTSGDGQERKLLKGGAVSEGDTVTTARNASAQIRTQDGGFIAVRPDTQLKFDSFKYTGKAGAPERSYFSLFKGGFRAVTGLIGRVRKNDYRITTPAATIGIRGTDHETIFLAQAIPGALAGAYSKVNIGETSLTTNKGTINVLPNQMGFAGGLNQLPQLQPINTNIFTVTVAPHAAKLGKEDESDSKAQGGEQQQANGTGAQEPAADQPEQKTAEAGSADAGTVPVPPIRETATVDSQQEALQVSVSVAPAPTKLADAAATVAPPPPPTVPVTATSGGLTLDTTAQTVTAGGTTV